MCDKCQNWAFLLLEISCDVRSTTDSHQVLFVLELAPLMVLLVLLLLFEWFQEFISHSFMPMFKKKTKKKVIKGKIMAVIYSLRYYTMMMMMSCYFFSNENCSVIRYRITIQFSISSESPNFKFGLSTRFVVNKNMYMMEWITKLKQIFSALLFKVDRNQPISLVIQQQYIFRKLLSSNNSQ